ncbi:MAG: BMP family ABC transporter substrate-binding protein, partial [Candidatus Thioglobus sp.]|nr:BMP family ABC transporter substrate-binding protein [Candidatus Thioglobus sp.]
MKNMKRSHLSGLIKKTGLAFIASTFLLVAPIAQADVKPAVVYDTAGKNDKSFNEAVYVNGVMKFMNDTGIAVTELEPTNEAMMEQSLKKFAQRG